MGLANNLYWKKTRRQMEKYLSAANMSESQKAEILADIELGKSPDSVQKKLKKALSGGSVSDIMNTVLFTAQGKEHLAVPLPSDLFKILKALAMKCQEEQMDLANILREPIVDSYRLIAGDQGLV